MGRPGVYVNKTACMSGFRVARKSTAFTCKFMAQCSVSKNTKAVYIVANDHFHHPRSRALSLSLSSSLCTFGLGSLELSRSSL